MREADQQGEAGQAWIIPPTRPEQAASLGTWLVNVPRGHQFWEWWVVSVVHLRDGETLPPAKLLYDTAEYEFTIITVDNEECLPDPDLAQEEGLAFYTPADIVEQFHGVHDTEAARIAEVAVREIVTGKISPDSQYRDRWKTMLEETLSGFKQGLMPCN